MTQPDAWEERYDTVITEKLTAAEARVMLDLIE